MVAVIVPVMVTLAAVSVPVKVGLALSDLVAIAVAMLVNSLSISEPRTILLGSPVIKKSLEVKLVTFV